MAYGNAVQSTDQPENPRLTVDSERLINDLVSIRGRVAQIADTLHGSPPKVVSGEKPGEPAVSNLRRNMDVAARIVSDIEAELHRCENNL